MTNKKREIKCRQLSPRTYEPGTLQSALHETHAFDVTHKLKGQEPCICPCGGFLRIKWPSTVQTRNAWARVWSQKVQSQRRWCTLLQRDWGKCARRSRCPLTGSWVWREERAKKARLFTVLSLQKLMDPGREKALERMTCGPWRLSTQNFSTQSLNWKRAGEWEAATTIHFIWDFDAPQRKARSWKGMVYLWFGFLIIRLVLTCIERVI